MQVQRLSSQPRAVSASTPLSSKDLLTPKLPVTERYEVLKQLGQGGMGVVFEAFDHRRERKVAMKILKDPERGSVYRFKREFRAASALLHPNVVRLFDLGTLPDGSFFFTMELVDGVSLSTLAASSPWSQPETGALAETLAAQSRPLGATLALADTVSANELISQDSKSHAQPSLLKIVAGILEGLRFLHRARKVHRDLKPANVMIDPNGEAKLLDFGIIRELDEPNHATVTRGAIGTPFYMSPEQISNKEITPAADIYSFGCLLYELLTGAPPFVGNPARVMAFHMTEAPERPSKKRPCDAALERLCLDALQKEPERRPSAEELLRRLHEEAKGPAPRPLFKQPKRSPGLLGREAELSFLEEKRAGLTRATVVLIGAESGAGKSALCAELGHRAQSKGSTAWYGRCYEREQVPYKAFDTIIDAAAVALLQRGVDRARLLPIGAASLLRLFPVLREVVGDVELAAETTLHDAKAERARATRALFSLLRNLSQDGPPVLLIDDLQWADPESIEALCWVATAKDAPPCLIVANYRSEEVSETHPLQQLMGCACVSRMTLPALSEEALSSLVDAYTTASIPTEQKKSLIQEAKRNPLLVVELSRVLQDGEHKTPTLGDIILRRLSAVSEAARQVLELSAVAGGKISFSLFLGVAGLSPSVLSEALDELLRAELLRESFGHEQEAFDLAHDQLRQAAYESISLEKRQRLHKTLAEHLEKLDDAARAVEHWRLANEPVRAREAALSAAKRAEEQLAFGRAAELYALATKDSPNGQLAWARAESLSKAGFRQLAALAFEEASILPGIDTREAKLRSATEHIAAGDFQRGLMAFRVLLVPYRTRLERPYIPRLIAVFWWMLVLTVCWFWCDLLERFGVNQKWREPSPELDFQMRLFLSVHESLFVFDPMIAMEYGLRFEGLSYHQKISKYMGQARLIHGRALAGFFGTLSSRRSFRHIQSGEALCADTGNVRGLLGAQFGRMFWHVFEGNREAVAMTNALCEDLARRGGLFGDPLLMIIRDLHLAEEYFSGDAAETLRRAAAHIADAKARGNIIDCVQPLAFQGLAHLLLHQPEAAKASFQEALSLCPKTPQTLLRHRIELFLTEVLLYEGKLEEGLQAIDDLEKRRQKAGLFVSNIETSFMTAQRARYFLSQPKGKARPPKLPWREFATNSAMLVTKISLLRIEAAFALRVGHLPKAQYKLEQALFLAEQRNSKLSMAVIYAARAAVRRKYKLPGAELDQARSETLLAALGLPKDCYFIRAEGWDKL